MAFRYGRSIVYGAPNFFVELKNDKACIPPKDDRKDLGIKNYKEHLELTNNYCEISTINTN